MVGEGQRGGERAGLRDFRGGASEPAYPLYFPNLPGSLDPGGFEGLEHEPVGPGPGIRAGIMPGFQFQKYLIGRSDEGDKALSGLDAGFQL